MKTIGLVISLALDCHRVRRRAGDHPDRPDSYGQDRRKLVADGTSRAAWR